MNAGLVTEDSERRDDIRIPTGNGEDLRGRVLRSSWIRTYKMVKNPSRVVVETAGLDEAADKFQVVSTKVTDTTD